MPGTPISERQGTWVLDLVELHRRLFALDQRDRQVIELRYGLWDQHRHSQAEVARRLGLTRNRVQQIERRAMSSLVSDDVGQALQGLGIECRHPSLGTDETNRRSNTASLAERGSARELGRTQSAPCIPSPRELPHSARQYAPTTAAGLEPAPIESGPRKQPGAMVRREHSGGVTDLHPAPRSLSARDAAIIAARAEGETLAEIGARFGISRERVRQILLLRGSGTQNARSRMARGARELAAAEVRRFELIAGWKAGLTPQAIASRTGLSRACVNTVIDTHASAADHAARRHVQALQAPKRRPRFSNQQLIEAIRAAAERADRVPTIKEYVGFAQATGSPSVSTIENRLGGWNAALRAAGLSPRKVRRSPYPRRWTEGACLEALRGLVLELGELPLMKHYDALARERPELPSAATIRIRLGSWNTLALRLAADIGPGESQTWPGQMLER